VTGTGEPGATATVYAPDGTTVLGTALVEPGGSYTVTIPAQLNGQELTVTLTDTAGNESEPTNVTAPDLFESFDNVGTAEIDLVAASTAVDVGEANYLALISLANVDFGLDIAGLQLLGIEPVSFSVEPGHSLDATFAYGGVLDIGLAADYTLVLQKLVDGVWSDINGEGESTLLDLNLLNGDLAVEQNLDAGEYRAFVTFEGLVGGGILGTLDVTGVDTDFTEIVDTVVTPAEGNVITDANGSGEADTVPEGTVVHSVTVNGTTTEVTVDGTVIDGEHGTLVIDLDGSYTYTPDEDAANIGAAETFTYTLQDPSGAQETATLYIQVDSPDAELVWGDPGSAATTGLAAVNDAATAGVLYENTVDTSTADLFTLSNGIGIIIPNTDTDTADFTVAADTQSDARVIIDASEGLSLAVLPSYTVTLRDSAGEVVGSPQTVQAIANVLGLGAGAVIDFSDLPAGNYSVEVTSTNTLGLGYDSVVSLEQTVTNLTEFQVDTVTGAEGNLLANDVSGSLFTTVLVDTGGGFTEVGATPATLVGSYGTLTVDAAGNYQYEPNADLPHSTTDQVDTFTYQIQHPNGEIVTAELAVTVDVSDPGAGAEAVALAADFEVDASDVIPLESVIASGEDDGGASTQTGIFEYDMFEGQGDLENVLENYLNEAPQTEEEAGGEFATASDSGGDDTQVVASPAPVDDPLGYLTINTLDDANDGNHSLI